MFLVAVADDAEMVPLAGSLAGVGRAAVEVVARAGRVGVGVRLGGVVVDLNFRADPRGLGRSIAAVKDAGVSAGADLPIEFKNVLFLKVGGFKMRWHHKPKIEIMKGGERGTKIE